MQNQITKTIYSTDREHRVHIIKRDDGHFSFIAERFSNDPFEMTWIDDRSVRAITICESEEMAELEARKRIDWLIQAQ